MDVKKIIFPLIAIIAMFALTGCEDDDFNGSYQEQIYYNLTSVTWYGEQTYYDGYGRPCLDMSYWDFYGDGTGMLETYTEIQGIPSGQNRVYFSWDFTDGSYSVIALAFPNGGFEYWSIDNLTSGYFASFVSELDPYYYPNTDYFYQELRAVY